MRFQCGTESVLQQLRKGQCRPQTRCKHGANALTARSNSTKVQHKNVHTSKYDIEILSQPLRFNSVTQIIR